jgi:hypothetical protein
MKSILVRDLGSDNSDGETVTGNNEVLNDGDHIY